MIEGLLWIIAEVIGQGIMFALPEFLLDLGLRKAKKNGANFDFVHPLFTVVVLAVVGYVTGIFSVYFFPDHVIKNEIVRQANLLITPIVMGFVFSRVGTHLERKGKFRTGLETFGGGFSFAFALAIARFVFAK